MGATKPYSTADTATWRSRFKKKKKKADKALNCKQDDTIWKSAPDFSV